MACARGEMDSSNKRACREERQEICRNELTIARKSYGERDAVVVAGKKVSTRVQIRQTDGVGVMQEHVEFARSGWERVQIFRKNQMSMFLEKKVWNE